MPLKLISLNIEGRKHLSKIEPFLQKESPDVACLQELYQEDVPFFERALEAESFFVKMGIDEKGRFGVGIFSKLPITSKMAHWYGGSTEEEPTFDGTNKETLHASQRFSLAVCEVEKEGALFRIGTTHFPVTKRGQPTDYQREDMQTLVGILESVGDFVLCGDFNAPRILDGAPGEIFGMLASHYTDNVPSHYQTSLDLVLHRAAKESVHEISERMVDGLFTSPHYSAGDVRLHSGVSDHCAIVATITKN